ncbi:MAG: hypothetical protein WD426_11180, partial [Anditalea sp.]
TQQMERNNIDKLSYLIHPTIWVCTINVICLILMMKPYRITSIFSNASTILLPAFSSNTPFRDFVTCFGFLTAKKAVPYSLLLKDQ